MAGMVLSRFGGREKWPNSGTEHGELDDLNTFAFAGANVDRVLEAKFGGHSACPGARRARGAVNVAIPWATYPPVT
jgi:hypothetical protein